MKQGRQKRQMSINNDSLTQMSTTFGFSPTLMKLMAAESDVENRHAFHLVSQKAPGVNKRREFEL